MSTKFNSIPTKRLAASINSSSTTLQLSDILGWDGVALTNAIIGDKLYATLRNPQGTLLEIMELDTTSISGTTFTITLRGLKFDGDLATEVTANKLSWTKGDTLIELGSDTPQLLNNLVRIVDAQTIAGVKTFSSLPATTAGNPVANNDLARKLYVDTVVAGIATTINVLVPATAGETISAGNLVYFDDTANEWLKCDADTAATVENTLLGIAQGAGTDGVAITGGVLIRGLDANQTGLTAGAIYYASNTAGGLSASAGTVEVTIGFAYSTTQLYFNPRFNQQLTEDQQDALAGNNTDITVGAGNKYVTQTGLQDSAEIYAASSTGNDTYVVTLSPVPTALHNGMVVRFKPDTANTGAATLNVNSLGALAIVTGLSTALATGDIVANQVCEVIYNSTGTVWQLVNPASVQLSALKVSNGTQSAIISTTYTITPGFRAKSIKLMAVQEGVVGGTTFSHGWYDTTTGGMGCTFVGHNTNGSITTGGSSINYALNITYGSSPTASTAVINNITATSFDIVFTKGSQNVTIYWEAIS